MRSDEELEQILRKAPTPSTPLGLEQRLIRQASRPKRKNSWSWFAIFQERSWAPALALFVVLTGLLTALGFQQNTLTELKRAQEELGAQASPVGSQGQNAGENGVERELTELQKQSVELERLREEMAQIESLLAQQPKLAQENAALRAELSSLTKNNPELSPEVQAELEKARKRAERIKCVNNLKQVGLAARIWAADNGDKDHLPNDVASMKNELSTPNILICPSDTARAKTVATWEQLTGSGSYEILSPGIAETVPTVVYARCPFHNNVLMVDGSVQQLREDRQVVQRDGHWEIGQ